MNNYIKFGIIIIVILIIRYSIKDRRKLSKSAKIFYSTDEFPITKLLEDNWRLIAQECSNLPKNVLIKSNGRLQNSWYGDDDFKELADLHFKNHGWINGWQANEKGTNNNWMNWGLVYDGILLGENAKMCPFTTQILSKIPGIQVAGFSIMKPGSMIHPHTDTTGLKYNSMAYHLGLNVPSDGDCNLYVLDNSMKEENGKAFLFDATYLHYAKNTSQKYDRAILYIAFDLNGIKKKNS